MGRVAGLRDAVGQPGASYRWALSLGVVSFLCLVGALASIDRPDPSAWGARALAVLSFGAGGLAVYLAVHLARAGELPWAALLLGAGVGGIAAVVFIAAIDPTLEEAGSFLYMGLLFLYWVFQLYGGVWLLIVSLLTAGAVSLPGRDREPATLRRAWSLAHGTLATQTVFHGVVGLWLVFAAGVHAETAREAYASTPGPGLVALIVSVALAVWLRYRRADG